MHSTIIIYQWFLSQACLQNLIILVVHITQLMHNYVYTLGSMDPLVCIIISTICIDNIDCYLWIYIKSLHGLQTSQITERMLHYAYVYLNNERVFKHLMGGCYRSQHPFLVRPSSVSRLMSLLLLS